MKAAAAIVWVLATSALFGRVGDTYTLTIVVDGARNSRGVIGVLVFNSERGWPENVSAAFRRFAVPAQMGSNTLVISGLPPGEYGVVVLHDENKNMKLDRTWYGRPKEQWGMSNNPPAHMSAPSFNAARFSLQNDARIQIRLR